MGIFGSYYEMFDEARNELNKLSKNNKTPLNELTIGGEKIDEDEDDFSIDNEEETADEGEAEEPDTPEGEAAPEPAAEDGEDIEPAQATAAADTPENANDAADTGDDIEDDFALPEDAGEDTTNADEGGETTDNPTDDATGGEDAGGDENEEDINDDFNMGDEGGDTGDGNTEENTGEEAGENAAEDGEAETGSAGGDEDELKQDEDKLYDTLSDEQKKIRTLQLKISFKDIYEQCDSVLNAINEIPKSDENIEVIRRLIVVINNVKTYITDYMSYEFDKNTYLDNNQVYIKYINVFRTIKKTIDELAKPQKD